jgi:antirestriction protein ArdC
MINQEPTVHTSTIYENVTRKIVQAIEKGAGTFEMPWHAMVDRPLNALTENKYQGINTLQLWVASQLEGYELPYWASYKQWQKLGAQVRRGEKAQLVVYYENRTEETRDEKGQIVENSYAVCRTSTAFNVAQVDGWTAPVMNMSDKTVSLEQAEALVKASGASIKQGGSEACYYPKGDYIQMPARKFFKDSATRSATEGYYGTLLHELTHWTGHPSRCNRDLKGRFGTEAYAMEELVAELGSAFLCADLKLTQEVRPDHAQYVASWLQVLKSDPKAIFTAASKAAYAADFLIKTQKALQPTQVKELQTVGER